jgi:UDP-N-acetylglucosamine acyltransferase
VEVSRPLARGAPSVHPTAIVASQARLAEGVVVGPWCVVGRGVRIGAGTVIGHSTTVEGRTTIGRDNRIGPYAVIGLPPQHLTDPGVEGAVGIGDRNVIREFVTVHVGTAGGGGLTRIGDDNYLMNYVHVAHDCLVGNGTVLANACNLGGHTAIGDRANLGGMVAVHQFVKVGELSMVGGASALRHDVPPYTMVEGNPARLRGLNLTGLKRNGFDPDMLATLKKGYRILFRSRLTVEQATRALASELDGIDVIRNLIAFMRGSRRGVCRERAARVDDSAVAAAAAPAGPD